MSEETSMATGRQRYKDKAGQAGTAPAREVEATPAPKPGSIASGIKLYQTKNNK